MPSFAYIAIDANSGREARGTLAEANEAAAREKLRSQGLFATQLTAGDSVAPAPSKIVPAPRRTVPKPMPSAKPTVAPTRASAAPLAKPKRFAKAWVLPGSRVVNGQGLAAFTRQLATLVRAGMPLLRGLEVLMRQEKRPAFRPVIESLAETIRTGGSLSDGMARHPRVFDRLYLNMIKAGEAGGVLDVVLDRLADFLEKAQRVRGKVKSAMTYPVIIMLVAAGIVGGLMVFVIPRFESIFASMLKGQPLPALTQVVLTISRMVQSNVLVTVGVAIAAVAGFRALGRSPWGGRWRDRVALALPVFGDLVLKAAVARFTRTLGTLLGAGVQILAALQITRDTAGNVVVAAAIERVHDRVKEGEGIAAPLEATQVFPGMVPGMIEVGEETGKLPDMLERIADTYDEEVDNAVAALTSILEPLMIVIMALVVGTIVIALFLPLVRIVQSLS